MSLFVDEKFLHTVSWTLRNFKKKSDYLWNFSCPICGDSKKNKLKARGFIFRYHNGLQYKCHNCGCTMPLGDFLKAVNPNAYKEWVYESYLEKRGGEVKEEPVEAQKKAFKEFQRKKAVKEEEKKGKRPEALVGCHAISNLAVDHPARMYVEGRKIPKEFFNQLFWSDDFSVVAKKLDPSQKLKKEGRLIIPFMDRQKNLLAVQGRSLDPDNPIRYITIKAFEDAPRIYGMHRLAKTYNRIYIVEGPFDSMFLPNCLAMAGSDIPVSLPREHLVVVYDNEASKPDTRAKVEKAINAGYNVCIWPRDVAYKDINDMIKAGYTAKKVRSIIDNNVYSGLAAKAKLQDWKKYQPMPTSPRKGHEQSTTEQDTDEGHDHQL